MKNNIEASVIISTYNQPNWLRKVLLGYNEQTFKNFELIIADDGSNEETSNLIKDIQKHLSYPVKHCWHPDNGFQKSVILNKAIIMSNTDYLIISDGDCIPRKDFLSIHMSSRKKGHFISGGMFRTTMSVAHKISDEAILDQRCFDIKNLHKWGQPKRFFKDLKLTLTSQFIKKTANFITPANASWNGHNSSGWKNDILNINGFDERMRYGGQDRELGERLMNSGIKGIQLRYSAICIHLEHGRGYVTDEDWARNYEIRRNTKKSKVAWTDFGLSNHK